MSGQVQHPSTVYSGSHTADATDSVMTRWLQSAGIQHLASPTASSGLDPRFLPNLMMQDYAKLGSQSIEDKQKLLRLLKSISTGVEPAADLVTPPRYGSGRHNGVNGLSSPELRGEIGAGILDVHAIDDIELLSADAVHEPFESSPFAAVAEKQYGNDTEGFWPIIKSQISKQGHNNEYSPMRSAANEKEVVGRDSGNGLARIKVVVRKRPLNRKEIARKEEDIITINDSGSSLTVHEPKLKVDLTAYVEKHDFVFDAVLDEQITNDEVYRRTVAPIIPTIFQRTKATCFAYGQTGSGKTFTMQPLPIRACQEILNLMQHRLYRNQGLQLWLSFFEIYGGKLFDLLNDRRKLFMREDGRQQVCIVGLKEFSVSDVELVKDLIEKGNACRSTGSTGANEESSRSHAILQLVIKNHSAKKEEREGKLVGKFSFIDLAGSERGADTTDNDRQTRIEGAEINKSLLALKECIRALDHEQGHIPFRGSKLTEVLRDSFVGDSRTVMISCISPNTGSCEHTLNTLRYADRVKGLSKSSSFKRDPSPNTGLQVQMDLTISPASQSAVFSESNIEQRVVGAFKKPSEQANWHSIPGEQDGRSGITSMSSRLLSREDSKNVFSSHERESATITSKVQQNAASIVRCMVRSELDSTSLSQHNVVEDDDCRKGGNSDLIEESRKERNNLVTRLQLQREDFGLNASQSRPQDAVDLLSSEGGCDDNITAILEEEEDLIAAHRSEVEETMELVREEMILLTEVDQPGSRIDQYVSQLSHVLARKAEGIINLQARLAKFQRRLKEEEIFSRNMSGQNLGTHRQ